MFVRAVISAISVTALQQSQRLLFIGVWLAVCYFQLLKS